MLAHVSQQLLDKIESFLGPPAGTQPYEWIGSLPYEWDEMEDKVLNDHPAIESWEELDESRTHEQDTKKIYCSDAWNEEIIALAKSDEPLKHWLDYFEQLRRNDYEILQNTYLPPELFPTEWKKISDPWIDELLIEDKAWKIPKIILSKTWNIQTSHRGHQCDDVLWEMSNACSETNHSIHTPTKKTDGLYIPNGLHVFKPLVPELFSDACRQLRQLYMDEDLNPTRYFSPDRTPGLSVPNKTMLVYTYKREIIDKVEGIRYVYPQQTIPETLNALRVRGYTALADFAEKHVHVLMRFTNSSYDDLITDGGIMFLRYAPLNDFRRHIDGTSGLGHSPGPVLNVAMGVHGLKIFDLMPSTCWEDGAKKPIRVTTRPGESILMCGESRAAWTHCIPEGETEWRYTMAIKLKQNQNNEYESTGFVADYEYKNYKPNMKHIKIIEN